jgi:hypothetical protein
MKKIILVLAMGLIIPIAIGALQLPEQYYCAVSPIEGPLYDTRPVEGLEDLSVYSYTFSIDIDKFKKALGYKGHLYLQIYNPETDRWINTGINASKDGVSDLTRKGVINYKIYSSKFGEPFLGQSKLRFVDKNGTALKDENNQESAEFDGPKIIADLKDEKYKRDQAGAYTYSVMARSESMQIIGLRGTLDKGNWVWVGSPLKSNSKTWTELEWKNATYYQVVEFKIFE